MELDWAVAFAFTQAVEIPLALWLLPDAPRWRVAAAAFVASALTHPAFWYLAPALFHDLWTWTITCELGIGVVEGFVLWRLAPTGRLSQGLAVSFQVNGASFLIGLTLQVLGLWPSV